KFHPSFLCVFVISYYYYFTVFLFILRSSRFFLFPYTTLFRSVTLIELGDGETIRSIAIGDSEAFQVDKLEGANVFTVKPVIPGRSEEHTSELQSRFDLVCRLLLEKKNIYTITKP